MRRFAFIIAFGLIALFFALTDGDPHVEERSPPTAEQAGAGRDAALRLRRGVNGDDDPKPVRLRREHLDALSVLASHGFRPDRIDLSVTDFVFKLKASRPLPLGRWINLTAETRESSEGFPDVHAQVGSVPMTPAISRILAEAGLWFVNAMGADLPALDDVVRAVELEEQSLLVTLDVPLENGLIDQLTGAGGGVDTALVSAAYCSLAEQQIDDPAGQFATHVQRAFPTQRAEFATPQSNKAAFVALAMAIVDPQVGMLAGVKPAQIDGCKMPRGTIVLHQRWDLPKHWTLSAALEASAGTQLAEAVGEWKELADSLPDGSQFQRRAGSGFSFVDIAADRSGFRIAQQAGDAMTARAMAQRLSEATEADLLPPSLLNLEEGRSVDFAGDFGSLDDDRYKVAIKAIDEALESDGMLGVP